MKNYFLFSISIITILLMSSSCGSNISPIKIDPCDNYDSLPPKILVYENLNDTSYLLQDTFFAGNSITFKCSKESDTYLWQIGTDDRRWTTKEVTLNFGYITKFTGVLPIKLITFRSQDTICNKKDNGLDTIIQYFQVEDPEKTVSPIFGTFIGTSTLNPKDTLVVNIKKTKDNYNVINGLPSSNCLDTYYYPGSPPNWIGFGYRSFRIFNSPGDDFKIGPCNDLCGNGSLDLISNKITIFYNNRKVIGDPKGGLPENRNYGVFTGHRKK